MRLIERIFLAFLMSISVVGCTRSGIAKEKIRLVIPFSNSSSSLAAGDMLKDAIVNIQVPGRAPILKEFDFHDNPIPWGTPLDLIVPGVPSGPGLLVQFLGVFESASGGATMLTYGDAVVNVGMGTTTVNLKAEPAGSSNKEGGVAGRYFTSSDSGPTGTVIAYYYPPNGKPRMAVDKSSILSGWFRIFAMDKTPLTYVVSESGITLFGNLTLDSAALSGETYRLRVAVPAHFKPEHDNGTMDVDAQAEQVHILGYFTDGGISVPDLNSSYQACYAGTTEGMPGLYRSYSGGVLGEPLVANLSAGTTAQMRVLDSSGAPISLENWGLDGCDPAANDLIYHHNRTREGDEGYAGMKPPFRLIDRFQPWGGYLRKEYNSNYNEIKLEWKYLNGADPGSSQSGLSGVEILYKYSTTGGGGDSHDTTCETLKMEGYQVLGSLTTSSESYTVNSTALPITYENHYAYQFAACPYALKNGEKFYVGEYVRSDGCSGGCNELTGYGWGTGDVTINNTGTINTLMSQKYEQVESVASTSYGYDEITISSNFGFGTLDIGKEIQIMVVGQGNTANCGSFEGRPIGYGMKAYARILSATSNTLKIPRGTFVRGLANGSLTLGATDPNFCRVFVTTIPHFRNLTITDFQTITADDFNYGSGGGMVAFRVAGTLSLGEQVEISAKGTGYSYGTGPDIPGDGYSGEGATNSAQGVLSVGGGGASVIANGGQGSLDGSTANGGAGGSAPFGGGGGEYGNQATLGLGGGGGGYDDSAPGGGIVFIAARYITASVDVKIDASGNSSGGKGGAGGGGSIAVMAEKILSNDPIQALANGGSSTSAGPEIGGAGGGGVISAFICTNSSKLLTPLSAVAGGTYVSTGASLPENGQVYRPSVNDYNPACSY